MIQQQQNENDDERFNQQAAKINQNYDQEMQVGQFNDEYPDMHQLKGQQGQDNNDINDNSTANSNRNSSRTNNDQNISINLNDQSQQNNVQKTNRERTDSFQEEEIGKFSRYMGNTFGFLTFRGDPIFTIGPHFCLFLITWSCMSGFSYFLIFKISSYKGDFWFYLTSLVGILQSSSYLLTALINPGILTAKRAGVSNPRSNSYCKKCDINKQKDDYHCQDCDVCIEEYDHHCPWTGKCIGKGNMPLFKVFISTTMFWFFYAIILLIN